MFKKNFLLLFLLFFCQSAFAGDRFNAGVSFDYKKTENPEINEVQNKLPVLEKDFIDLNYSIDYKPLNLLGLDDFVIKKQNSVTKFQTPSFVPENYEVSLSTGQIKGNVNSTNQLENLIRKNPENKDLLFAYAIQLKNEGRLKEALSVADKAVETDPDFALAHFLRGDILRTMERFREAADEYIYTTQINPYCADAYYNIAKILELLDNRELALDYYKTAYQVNPNDVEIRDIILKHYIDL